MNESQKLLLAHRISQFDEFRENIIPTLIQFVEVMGVKPGSLVETDAPGLLPYINESMETLDVGVDRVRVRIILGLGEFLGEYFRQKFHGIWMVDESPESESFAQFAVGNLRDLSDQKIIIAPFPMAISFVDSPFPRDLNRIVSSVELRLKQYAS